jgi:hypothetical protein
MSSVVAVDFDTPVPNEEEEVSAGPVPKFTTATQMRFDAFQDVVEEVNMNSFSDKMHLDLYSLNDKKNFLVRKKLDNAKIIEYTNGCFDVKFKNIPNTIFCYDKFGDLQYYATYTNSGKVPFTTYYYDKNGIISLIEIKPDRYYSCVYDLYGLLVRYCTNNRWYSPDNNIIRKKKGLV